MVTFPEFPNPESAQDVAVLAFDRAFPAREWMGQKFDEGRASGRVVPGCHVGCCLPSNTFPECGIAEEDLHPSRRVRQSGFRPDGSRQWSEVLIFRNRGDDRYEVEGNETGVDVVGEIQNPRPRGHDDGSAQGHPLHRNKSQALGSVEGNNDVTAGEKGEGFQVAEWVFNQPDARVRSGGSAKFRHGTGVGGMEGRVVDLDDEGDRNVPRERHLERADGTPGVLALDVAPHVEGIEEHHPVGRQSEPTAIGLDGFRDGHRLGKVEDGFVGEGVRQGFEDEQGWSEDDIHLTEHRGPPRGKDRQFPKWDRHIEASFVSEGRKL